MSVGALRVTVHNRTGLPLRVRFLAKVARRAVRSSRRGIRPAIAVLDDTQMRKLHCRSLGRRSTTDVLAFPAERAGGSPEADIAICADAARREARKRGHPLHWELALYLVHGILHLAGFDDHTPRGRKRMWKRQAEILQRLGIRLKS